MIHLVVWHTCGSPGSAAGILSWPGRCPSHASELPQPICRVLWLRRWPSHCHSGSYSEDTAQCFLCQVGIYQVLLDPASDWMQRIHALRPWELLAAMPCHCVLSGSPGSFIVRHLLSPEYSGRVVKNALHMPVPVFLLMLYCVIWSAMPHAVHETKIGPHRHAFAERRVYLAGLTTSVCPFQQLKQN